jgi:uncharacterized protein YkwD
VLRKTLPFIVALLPLVVPASANAGFMAKRVPFASMAPARHGHAVRHGHAARHRAARALSATSCADADLMPAAGNLARIRAAVLCLHNRIRAQHGLPPLHEARQLRHVAAGHSDDMVARRYFDHTTPGGRTMVDRILGSGYVRRQQNWLLGENLEWGTGSLATPRGAVQAWLDSPPHRANLLKRGYREVGIGVALGVPTGRARGATYTVDFGARQ